MDYYLHYQNWHENTEESRKTDIACAKEFINLHNLLPVKNGKILELGCGMGRFMLALKELGYENITGVDIEPQFIKIVTGEGLNAIQSDVMEFLRNSNEMYDAIYCFDVIEHIQKEYQEELFIELYKHLNENGFVAIKTINALAPMASYYRYLDFTHNLSYAPFTIEFLAKNANFEEIIIRPEFEESEHIKALKKNYAELCYHQFRMRDAILTPNLVAILLKSKSDEIINVFKENLPKIESGYFTYHYEDFPLKKLIQYYISKIVYLFSFGKIDLYNLKDIKYKFCISVGVKRK